MDLIDKIKRKYTKKESSAKAVRATNPSPYIGVLLPIPERTGWLSRVSPEKSAAADQKDDGQARALQEWLKSAKDYGKQFLEALNERKILHFQQVDDYLSSGSIFKDICFLSASSVPKKTSVLKAVRPRNGNANIDLELKRLPRLRVVFVFSTRIWDALYKKYQPVLVGGRPTPVSAKITKVHGLPFEMDYAGRKILLIPLVQMDQKVFNNLLRNSYFDYLADGLAEVPRYLQI